MFLPQFILSIVFVLAGFLMMKFPPKKINPLYGYRTARSMKSTEAWNYAQRVSARRMLLCGLAGMLIFIIISVLKFDEGIHGISMIATLVITIFYTFYSVERDLKEKFPDVRP
jgi:uncharacterized membrane protein